MEHLRPYAFFDGKIVPVEEVKIHAFDLGFMRGLCVFDFLRFRNKKTIFLSKHLDRLFNSAALMGIPIVYTKEEYTKSVNDLIEKNNESEGTVRIILSAGPLTTGFDITHPYVIIFIEPYHVISLEYYELGAKLITVRGDRALPQAKHTNYSIPGANEAKKKAAKALEILYVDQNNMVHEPATSNICIVKDGKVISPKSGVLEGVTLMKATEAAKNIGIDIERTDFTLDELLSADEAFIVATNKDVLPITQIDETTIGNGKPGEITNEILVAYRALMSETN
jgi:branched-chain amino acid aminotransferase